tara:strand:- start:5272 stop:6030 length:759 start_codon:yes stop_codon:yes gene_type:complete
MNIILIGASGRIGSELAIYLLKMGYDLALGDIDTKFIKSKLDALPEFTDRKVFIQDLDMCSEEQYKEWINDANSYFGRIDGAINCSYPRGKNYGAKLENVSLDDFNNNVSLHLGSYFNFLNITSSFMKINLLEGSIVCTSSIYGHIAPKFSVYDDTDMTMPVEYAAVKSSINHLIRYFASYYSGKGLRFNAVSPGGILDNQPNNFIKAYANESINKGLLDSKDVIPLLEFMISSKSKYINGQIITVDDGFSL